MRRFLSNDPNNSTRGLKFCFFYKKKNIQQPQTDPTENNMHNMHKSSIKRELLSTAVNSQINRQGVTLHFFRFLGDFDKGFPEPNVPLHYLLS